MRLCTQNGNSLNAKIAVSCNSVAELPLDSSTVYSITVQGDDGRLIDGVKFFGNSNFSSKLSDTLRTTSVAGSIAFNTLQLEAAADDLIRIVPTGNYQFNPTVLNLRPNSCGYNKCKIIAIANGQKAGALAINVSQGQTPLSAATRLLRLGVDGGALPSPARFRTAAAAARP